MRHWAILDLGKGFGQPIIALDLRDQGTKSLKPAKGWRDLDRFAVSSY
jgi:hypothetical protein